VDVDAAPADLVDQPRALDLVEAQAAPQRLDGPSILGDAASAGVGRERGIDFRGYVAKVKRGHDPYANELGAPLLALAAHAGWSFPPLMTSDGTETAGVTLRVHR